MFFPMHSPAHKLSLITGVAFTALAAGMGVPAFAQAPINNDTGASSRDKLVEIVVTARRKEENLQDIPVSVGTLSQQALHDNQISNVNDLGAVVAGLFTAKTPVPGGGYLTIRGIQNNPLPTPSADSAVGFYVDGIYIARGEANGFDIPDLARVEVARGPQGTLFGRNTTGGAINFITNQPTDQYEAHARFLYGSYAHVLGSAVVNLPITRDFMIRAAFQHNQGDGDITNTATRNTFDYPGYGAFKSEQRFGGTNSDNYVIKLLYTGIDKLTVNYKYDYSDFQDFAYGGQPIGYAPNALTTLLGPNAFFPGSGPAYVPAAPGSFTPSFNRLGALALPFQSDPANHVQGHTLTLEYELNRDLRLKNIASYRQLDSPSWQDLDGGALVTGPAYAALGVPEGIPACLSCSYNALRQHQITEEAQLLGNYGPLNFTSGVFYFHENSSYLLAYGQGKGPIFPAPTPNIFTPTDLAFGEHGLYVNGSYAGYVHADYTFTDWLKLAVGGRYTTDDRKTVDFRGLVVTGNIAAPYALGGPVTQGEVTYHRFNYDAALDLQLSPGVMAYTKYSTGYLSGGIQGSHPFTPQDTQQAEVGLKSEWLDHRLRVNGAAYYTWTQNRQAVIINQGQFLDLPVGLVYANEVGTTKIAGLEFETIFKPIQPLTLTANYGFNNPRYPDGTRPLAAKQTFSFSGQYNFPEFNNRSHVLIRFDGDYRGRYFAQNVNYDTPNGFIATAPIPANLYQTLGYASQDDYLAAVFKASQAGGYWLLNARLALVDLSVGKTVGRISAFVRNLADERGLSYASLSGATVDGIYERPRTYGIELNFDFN